MSQIYCSARVPLRVAILLLSVCFSACAQMQHQTNQRVELALRANKAEAALTILDSQSVAQKTSVLYLLNKAMVLRQMERYQESVEAFEKAKHKIGRLSALSISESLMAYTVTEQFKGYVPATYEHVFVHIFQILNFLALGQRDSARVEALQIDVTLNLLSDAGHYKEAAFARYMTGLVFEANHEHDDAYIAYQRAQQNYQNAQHPVPKDLQQRLKYLASVSDHIAPPQGEVRPILSNAHNESEVKVNDGSVRPGESQGQLVIFAHMDFAPPKTFMDTTLADSATGHIFRVSLPHYLSRHVDGIRVQFTLNDSTFSSQIATDIEAIAMSDLNRKMPGLKRKALSRNISKYALAEKASEEHEILGHMVSIFGALMEQADNRSWLTLPNNIQVASQLLEAGAYSLSIDVLDQNNQVIEHKNIDDINIAAKQFTFINFTWQYMPEHSIH